jgi:hypothetical protein
MLRGSVEAMALAGYCLRKAGLSTKLTPSQLITNFLPDINNRLRLKLMHLRITTIADVMIFHYWPIQDNELRNMILCIASEWYTIAYMRWRFHFEASLDFTDPDDCVRGANMLLFLEENLQHNISEEDLKLLQFANAWLRGPIRHEFQAPYRFSAKLLCDIFGSLRVALFAHDDNTSFTAHKRMPEDKWTRLLHNSVSDNKGMPSPTGKRLLLPLQGILPTYIQNYFGQQPISMMSSPDATHL